MMVIFFGQSGQPIASIDESAVFSRTGEQIAFLADDLIFKCDDGAFIGSVVMGVIYNADGLPQAFSEGCKPAFPLLRPKLGMLPPKVKMIGKDIRDLPHKSLPEFLREKLVELSFVLKQVGPSK